MMKEKMEKVYSDLAENGFKCEAVKNGIRVKLDIPGFTNATMDLNIFDLTESMKDKNETGFDSIDKDIELSSGYNFGCKGKKKLYFANIFSIELTNVQKNYINARKTVDFLYGVNLKMFRESLDKIGLSRSGIIRLSLTKIYRAAVDAETLIGALSEEADRIVRADEQKNLKKLIPIVRDPFVKSIIFLLCDTIEIKSN